MSPEERELLNRSVALAQDNNKILRSMRRSMFWARVISMIYWALIIGSAVGAYYFIQPYLNQAISIYNTAQGNLDNVGKIINSFKK